MFFPRDQFFRYVSSSWERAYLSAKLLPKDMMPVQLIYVSRGQLVLDKSHYLSPKWKDNPTKFRVRIKGKGFRRIYRGFKILGHEWHLELKKFFSGGLGDSSVSYYFVEVDHEPVVIILNFDFQSDIDDL